MGFFKKKEKKDKKNMTFKEKVIDNIKVFFSAYIIAFFIRLLLIEAYQIPSQSMVPSLLVKDILMVEKLTSGTYIPILNWKIPMLLKPKRNDIIVFISPAWKSPGKLNEFISLISLSLINLDNTFDTPKNLVKRLIAEPGDTVFMSNQTLYINGKIVKRDYIITAQQKIYDRMVHRGYLYYDIYLETYENKKRLVQHMTEKLPFFYDRSLIYEFPEIYVPKKGDVIILTNRNLYFLGLMKKLIERETGKTLTLLSDKLYLEGKEIKEWKIKENYYFAMGDNRDNSEDSRYFGFIPERNIFGRILFRYFPFHRIAFIINENEKSILKMNNY